MIHVTLSNPALAEHVCKLANRAERWMLEDAFPFWAARSASPAGGFYERLDLDGCGIPGEPSRVRLQARMVFTFALAAKMGWDRKRAEALALRGADTLIAECLRSDGLAGKLVQPGHGLVDDTAETYDTAFVLLALATVAEVFGSASAEVAARRLSSKVDQILAYEAAGEGYRERLPAPAIREQNPHMHLTEASLAWYEASKDVASLRRANETISFVKERFVDQASGLLLEYSGGVSAENRAEAGHMFEWVWILGRLQTLAGNAPIDLMRGLHDGGMRLLRGADYLPLSQHCDGSVLDAKQRTWGPTEKLKGHIAMWRAEPSDKLLELISETAEGLFADHVDDALPGAWIDTVGPDKLPMVEDITPATGYHIFLAFNELMQLASDLETSV